MSDNKKENWLTDEQKDKIIRMYHECDLTYSQIAQRVGRTRSSVISFIRRSIERGEITSRPKEKANKLKGTGKKSIIRLNRNKQIFEPDGVCVNCTAEIASKCIYGSKNPMFLCDYFDVSGVSTRLNVAPDHTKCTAFTSIKNAKKQRRRVDGFGREQLI